MISLKKKKIMLRLNPSSVGPDTHKHADTPSINSCQALQKQWHVKHMNNPHVPSQNCKLGPVKQSVLSELASQKQTKEKEREKGDGERMDRVQKERKKQNADGLFA